MRQTKSYFMGVGLVLALVLGAVFSQTIAFEQTVEAQSNQTKQWEIMVVHGTDLPESVQGGVNIRGAEGWELVTVQQTKEGNFMAFLKRRK
ncbi:MAG TPA: hypothetical protein VF596_09630 [Pyrinomonadaceae bacterium]|jgi:hypothetical protein